MEQQTGSKLGKEYLKFKYPHPAYLSYMKYIMWNARLDEALAAIKMLGEISVTSDMQVMPPLWQKLKKK